MAFEPGLGSVGPAPEAVVELLLDIGNPAGVDLGHHDGEVRHPIEHAGVEELHHDRGCREEANVTGGMAGGDAVRRVHVEGQVVLQRHVHVEGKASLCDR